MPRVTEILGREGLIEASAKMPEDPVGDLTREPLSFPLTAICACRRWRAATRAFLLALGYSTQRGYGRNHPFVGEIRLGEVEVEFMAEMWLCRAARLDHADRMPDGQPVQGLGQGAAAVHPRLRPRLRPVERKAMSMALVDRTLRAARTRRGHHRAGAGRGIRHVAFRQCAGDRLRRASEAAALCRLPGRDSAPLRKLRKEFADANETPVALQEAARMNAPTYNFAYLDEQTKRMIRRAILKAIAIPGYQVPFASREMPMPYGWGTGGVQVTAAIIGPDDKLKVIDQGADDTTNAISIRAFFEKVAGVAVTTSTGDATIIQTRHRIPERRCRRQVLVYQVPIPEPLRFLEPRETETRQDACARGIRPDACEALRGHRPLRPYRHDLCLSGEGQWRVT
jgi:hypothetical protein